MRVIFFVAAATAAVLIAVGPAQAQAIPDLNVDPVCHGIAQQAADPSEKGGPDLAFSKCVQSEQAMRQKLVNEWSTFLPTDPIASASKWAEWRAIPISSAAWKWRRTRGSLIKASE